MASGTVVISRVSTLVCKSAISASIWAVSAAAPPLLPERTKINWSSDPKLKILSGNRLGKPKLFRNLILRHVHIFWEGHKNLTKTSSWTTNQLPDFVIFLWSSQSEYTNLRKTIKHFFIHFTIYKVECANFRMWSLWQYRLSSFQAGDTKLENLTNFISPAWKLDNPYYQTLHKFLVKFLIIGKIEYLRYVCMTLLWISRR